MPAPDHRPREGRRIAQLFRKFRLPDHGRNERRCDLEAILDEDGLEVCESEVVNCGYAACLIRAPERGGGIMISAGQSSGRRRFSLAHELGHFHIPSHKNVGVLLPDVGMAFSCAESDLRVRSTDARFRESEANDFASELLMPYTMFADDVGNREATFHTAIELSSPDVYDVSVTAAAWRLVETTRERCALIMCADGQVEWAVRSQAWGFSLPERHRPVPDGSIAACLTVGEPVNAEAESVDPAVWLASADGRISVPPGFTLLESTHAIPRFQQTLSLLWLIDAD